MDGVLGCCRRACGVAWGVCWRSGSGGGVRGTVWRDSMGESDDCFDIARGKKTSNLEVLLYKFIIVLGRIRRVIYI